MKEDEVKEIIECLPKGRTLFPYHRDRYATLLLSWVFQQAVTVAEVKRTRYAGLITKPAVRDAIAHRGNGIIDPLLLASVWDEPHEQFLLTLDTWGGGARHWQQTSRAGHNLVLQINLHDGYRRLFEHTVPEDEQWLFDNFGHPALTPGNSDFYRPTLGWVRIDLDLCTGEALIEEIQSDWLRDMRTLLGWHTHDDNHNVRCYCEAMLARLGKIWSEVILTAALWFVRDELGVRQIWFHTDTSGRELKRIKGNAPPKSLYTRLPRKFCFAPTREPPLFLQRDKSFRRTIRGKPAPHWFHLQL